MGYDVTNNSSVVELVPGGSLPSGNDLTPISLPSVTPAPPELIKEDYGPDTRGTITIQAEGGVPPYTYSIDGVNYQTSNVFTNVNKNDITVYIKDSVGTIVTIEGIDASGTIHYVEGVTAIPIPEVLPSDPKILTEGPPASSGSSTITLPPTVPPDGVVMLETIELPRFLQDGGDAGVSRLEDLEDVDISSRSDADLLTYDQSTNSYKHVTPVVTDLHYIHSQGIAAQTWNIVHNLGKRPAIHVEDMSGNEMIPQIIHIDNNNAQAVFGSATYSGTAYCN